MLHLSLLQKDLDEWRARNFPNSDATEHLLGAVEEIGELSHAHLKSMQGIRGTSEKHEAAAKDAVGDAVLFLMGYCSNNGWSFEDILADTAAHVLKRDWIKDAFSGGERVGFSEDENR